MTGRPKLLRKAGRACRAAVVVLLADGACGAPYVPAQLSHPAVASTSSLEVEVPRVFLASEDRRSGWGDDSALIVELTVRNRGPHPFIARPTTFSVFLEPEWGPRSETLSLTPGGGAEGTFEGDWSFETSLLQPIEIPPEQTRTLWALFRGYRFPDSDVPRRVTLSIPDGAGARITLTLAAPSQGRPQWKIPPAENRTMIGIQNTALLGSHLQATGVGTRVSWSRAMEHFSVDVGLDSVLLVQSHGKLVSSTSSFLGSGVDLRLTLPLRTWGEPPDLRRLGIYAGGSALFLSEIQARDAPSSGKLNLPRTYGVLSADIGLELDLGTLRLGPTPFPLSSARPGLGRWSLRAGYTHWWIGGGSTDGYTTNVRVAW